MGDNIFGIEDQENTWTKLMKDEEALEHQLKINYNVVFSSKEGFEVLKDILATGHVMSISYVQNNQYETAFREGERNLALYILSKLNDELRAKTLGG